MAIRINVLPPVQSIAQADQDLGSSACISQTSSLLLALAPAPEPESPPWEAVPGYTILDALKEHARKTKPGRTLRLMSTKGHGTYEVKSWNEQDGRAVLHGPNGMVLNPVIGQREVPLYTPFWS